VNVRRRGLEPGRSAPERASLLIASRNDKIRQVAIEDSGSVADEEIMERIGIGHSKKLCVALALLVAKSPGLPP